MGARSIPGALAARVRAGEPAAARGGLIDMARLSKWIVLVLALGCANGPAVAQDAEVESCVGKVRLRGPLWDPQTGALEPGLDVVFDEAAGTIRERCAGKSIVIEAHAFELPSPELNQRLSELRAAIV